MEDTLNTVGITCSNFEEIQGTSDVYESNSVIIKNGNKLGKTEFKNKSKEFLTATILEEEKKINPTPKSIIIKVKK